MLTLDLKKSNDNLVVHGKLIVYLSTNVSQPISNPGPSAVNGLSAALANMGIEESASLSPAAASSSGPAGAALSRTPSHQAGQATPQPEAQATMQMPTPQVTRSPTAAVVASGTGPGAGADGSETATATSSSRPVSGALTVNTASNAGTNATSSPTATTANNPPHPTVPANASTNANPVTRNFNPHEDHLGPLPGGWERRIDPLGRTYYVDHTYAHLCSFSSVHLTHLPRIIHSTRSTTWHRPSASQATNTTTQQGETNAARDQHSRRVLADDMVETTNVNRATSASAAATTPIATTQQTTAGNGPLPAGWEERFTPEGRPYYVDHS